MDTSILIYQKGFSNEELVIHNQPPEQFRKILFYLSNNFEDKSEQPS